MEMKKKIIRIILALTILLPYWAFIGFCIFFPVGGMIMIMAPFVIIGKLVKLCLGENTQHEKKELKFEIIDDASMLICPLIGAYAKAEDFVKTGSLSI